MKIAICIATCDRLSGLQRLLESIAQLDVASDPPVECRVVIIDNHPDASGRAVVDACSTILPFPITYEQESKRGIPFARNAAITHASDAEFVVFVDDDQTVDPDWLAELVRVQRETGADVVTGPALTRLPDEPPAWAQRSGVFDLLRFETGAERSVAYTHNVLTRMDVFRQLWPAFDARFATTGGSDSHFYRRAVRAGFRIVWADDALTWEWVPASRVTVRWLLRRSTRIGTTDAFIARDLDGLRSVPSTLLLAARYGVRGVLRGLAIWNGRVAWIRAGFDLARAAGLVGGVIGLNCHEYRVRA